VGVAANIEEVAFDVEEVRLGDDSDGDKLEDRVQAFMKINAMIRKRSVILSLLITKYNE
jgi:hypothetical protein